MTDNKRPSGSAAGEQSVSLRALSDLADGLLDVCDRMIDALDKLARKSSDDQL